MTLLPDDPIDPESVRYAAVWKPQPGALSAFPNLAIIFNLNASRGGLQVESDILAALDNGTPIVSVSVSRLGRSGRWGR